MKNRTVRTQFGARRDDVADLVTRRPDHAMERLNPFLFINHHGPQVYPPGNRGLPFGPHPHRGFETVTFIVEGSLVHRDSAGHESAIGAGGIQWMTAGRGVEHSETSSREFMDRGGPLEILQLWINLPARLKMTTPRYTGLQKDDIPSFKEGGATVNLIAGEWNDHRGPIQSLTGVSMMTVSMPEGATVTLPAPAGRRVFLYIVRGNVRVSGTDVETWRLVEFNDDGSSVEIEAVEDALVIFGHADPLGEPIAAQGPFVMNTRAEIIQTIRDYQSGAFGEALTDA
ncbi:MAG: pirin family protein [Acidobacteriota bacterium]